MQPGGLSLCAWPVQARTGGITEFVPLPFVHMEAPIYLKGLPSCRVADGSLHAPTRLQSACAAVRCRAGAEGPHAARVLPDACRGAPRLRAAAAQYPGCCSVPDSEQDACKHNGPACAVHAWGWCAEQSLFRRQASWVKMGPERAAALLASGCNDMGGSIMNESITRAAGAM